MSVFSNPASAAQDEAAAYVSAIFAILGEQNPLTILRRTPAELRGAVDGRTPDELQRPERPGKWSALQVIQHLADSDLVWAYRMRMVLAEDRPRLTGYDQDLWATRLQYQGVNLNDALEQFEVLRTLNLRLLGGLDSAALQRVGIHSDRGEERLDHMVRLYAGHDLVHLRQLTRILEAAEQQ
ncbi:MAG: hypothetical protein GTO22_19535 [Gemmatimonadales bacterium]|nr:hypothetical protein [Gemmatimonadales bacterium]